MVSMPVGPQMPGPPNEVDEEEDSKSSKNKKESKKYKWGETLFKMFEAALTTFASVAILGFVYSNRQSLLQSNANGMQLGWL